MFTTSQKSLLCSYLFLTYSKFLLSGKCLSFPFKIKIQTQSTCNGRCSICPYPVLSEKLEQGRMDKTLFDKIVNEVSSHKYPAIILLGLQNEPLLDKRIFDLIRQVKSQSPDRYCTITTNGELLDTYSLTDIVKSEIDKLTVSLNANSKETFERINSGLDYDRIRQNIKELMKNSVLRNKLVVSFVPTQSNCDELGQALNYWKSQNILTRISGITNRAGTLINYKSQRPDSLISSESVAVKIWNSATTIARNKIGCEMLFYQMNILFNGDVILCCHDWNRATVIGNVKDKSVMSIWNSDRANQIRHLLCKRNYEKIATCRQCSFIKGE